MSWNSDWTLLLVLFVLIGVITFWIISTKKELIHIQDQMKHILDQFVQALQNRYFVSVELDKICFMESLIASSIPIDFQKAHLYSIEEVQQFSTSLSLFTQQLQDSMAWKQLKQDDMLAIKLQNSIEHVVAIERMLLSIGQKFNHRIKQFPQVLVANAMSLEPIRFLENSPVELTSNEK
jgi:uncharacterized protein